MKTFEEKWTAWIDGELTGHDLVEFEASLADRAAAQAEKDDAKKLGTFLKEHLPCRAMGNEEFFHHQLRERIASDTAVPTSPSAGGDRGWWPIGRLAWVGATALALFSVCTFFVMRAVSVAGPECASRPGGEPERDDYDVRIERGQSDNPLGGGIAVPAVGIRLKIVCCHATTLRAAAWPCPGADFRRRRGARRGDGLERIGHRE
jgi:hypothetical protein